MKRLLRKRGIKRMAKAGVGIARGLLVFPHAWLGWFRPRDELAQAVADLLFLGVIGETRWSLPARLLARQVQRGQVGAIVLIERNVGSADQVSGLVNLFRKGNSSVLIGMDQEGGVVQRLKKDHGVSNLLAAHRMTVKHSPDSAQKRYARVGRDLKRFGINLNLGPVLDVADPENPAIGRFKRAFSDDPECIATYGEAFIAGFGGAGVACVAKHFPGQGKAVTDSHLGVPDITRTWTEDQIEPYRRLIASDHAPHMIMMGHLRLDVIEPSGTPATVSRPIVTGLLREELGFRGVIVTDDIDMGGGNHRVKRRENFIASLAAGNDMIMILNLLGYDPLLPQRAVRWVRVAIANGQLSKVEILASAERVRAVRRKISEKAS